MTKSHDFSAVRLGLAHQPANETPVVVVPRPPANMDQRSGRFQPYRPANSGASAPTEGRSDYHDDPGSTGRDEPEQITPVADNATALQPAIAP